MNFNEKAAEWWADKIRCVCDENYNNGDDNPFVTLLATMNASAHEVSEERLKEFQEALAESILKEMKTRRELILSCDYGPDRLLYDLAKKYGIHTSRFPFKTGMWITPQDVRVCYGYGQPIETIWRK